MEEPEVNNILFLDIETVPNYQTYKDAPEICKKLWDKKARILSKSDEQSGEDLYERAGIYAEFGRIVCISAGYLSGGFGDKKFRVTSFAGDDEKKLLLDFANLINTYFSTNNHFLCAHNGKEFDFPYTARRMLIQGVNLPNQLKLAGKKPWEIKHLDTMELWKFGDWKSYTSLELLAYCFNVPTPKDDIDGSQIYEVYYNQNDLERIIKYCQKDVITLARVYLKYLGLEGIHDEDVVEV